MEHSEKKHEKIRFRRDEVADLASFPSAAGSATPVRGPSRVPRWLRGALRAAATLVGLAFVLVVTISVLGVAGVGSETLRAKAQAALAKASGPNFTSLAGRAQLAIDGASLLGLELHDTSLRRSQDGALAVNADAIHIGVHMLPLLAGNVRLASVRVSDARIDLAAMPSRDGRDWTAKMRNAEGLLDPEGISKALFEALGQMLSTLRADEPGRVDFTNIELVMPAGGAVGSIRIVAAQLARVGDAEVAFTASVDVDGRIVDLDGAATREASSSRVSSFKVSARLQPGTEPGVELADASIVGAPDTSASAVQRPPGSSLGTAEVSISGAEGEGQTPSVVDAKISVSAVSLDLGRRGVLSGDLDFSGKLVDGSNKVAVERMRATIGRSQFDFYGSIGPRPPTGVAGDASAYRFDLISANSTLAPESSPENPLQTYLRLAGAYRATEKVLAVDEIVIKGGPGEALGSAEVAFEDGKSPGIALAMSVHDMEVGHVKQLWPWFAAPNSRQWVLDKLFGGHVPDGRIRLRVEPGRLQTGVPLNGEEVSGRFSIDHTRFDTAGLIPPARDAAGTVEFRGPDVDIALSRGTLFLPSGNSVTASNGTLTVRNTSKPPIIGDLDIDIAGDATAVAELASFDPINAMRFIGFQPSEFSGTVDGHIKAQIPLQKGIAASTLDWLVSLNYKDLAISRLVDGQMVTGAIGSIVVDRTKAIIKADAKLNGVAARIDAVQPIGPNGPMRQRTVVMDLDDKARNLLAPGLSDMISGKTKVTAEALGDGRQKIVADLTDAKLDVRWAGWSKGAGIAAEASFVLSAVNGETTLSDFNLAGKSFGARGTIALSGGNLAKAAFTSVKLNRSDDIALKVGRSGDGYDVDIKGDALDARALIKQFTADAGPVKEVTRSSKVTVRASVGALTGFHDERLSGVQLDYVGRDGRVVALDVKATAASGGALRILNASKGGGRTLNMVSADAGAILRFLDIYDKMEGGRIDMSLAGGRDGPMRGQVDARDFVLVNESRLGSLVSTTPAGSNMSLSEAVKRDIDTSRVSFDRGFSQIDKGDGYLKLANGVLRGSLIGATFQGTLFDKAKNMAVTGTFMPAYGINSLFGDIPLIGALLGNGRDGGLIGVTFKLEGKAGSPQLTINPLSVIAPGIFRSIFEF